MPTLIALLVVLAVACGLAASCTGRPGAPQAQGPGTATPTWTPWPWERTATAEAIAVLQTATQAAVVVTATAEAVRAEATAAALATRTRGADRMRARGLIAEATAFAVTPPPTPVRLDPRRIVTDVDRYLGRWVLLVGRVGAATVRGDTVVAWFRADVPGNARLVEDLVVIADARVRLLRGDCYEVAGFVWTKPDEGMTRLVDGVPLGYPWLRATDVAPSPRCR